jgi:manganese oxidase
MQPVRSRKSPWLTGVSLSGVLLLALGGPSEAQTAAPACQRQLTANVVALDQVFFYNRLGAVNPGGMIYALRRDVVDASTGKTEAQGGVLTPGRVALRPDKRPRPLVLRMNVRDCLTINFQNLLNPVRENDNQPVTRNAGLHVTGLQLVTSIADDGSNVGANASSLAAPGGKRTYKLFAERENGYLFYSPASQTGGQGDGGALAFGLFGTVNVEPVGAEYYRSDLTNADLRIATVGTAPTGQPLLNYDAVYPVGHPQAGAPVLKILQGTEIVRSDLNAIITGPGRGNFPAGTYPPNPTLEPNASVPQAPGLPVRPREEPFREFTVVFHDEVFAVQAFPGFFNDPVFRHTLGGVKDGFAINYGTGGIGSEILANRLGVGPQFACNDCKYEEFFLTSWALGDPALVVDVPANVGLENLAPGQTPPVGAVGRKATKAFYPDDPSNVHHSYIGDHVKFRNVHAGPKEHHIFHLHAHQWLFTPDSDNSSYLDSQAIGPGSNYTYEIAFNGSGNRNQTVGDAIFHCHFYPHFAQGMWELWRNHDTFEAGTPLDAAGRPAAGSRAYPDAEILAGTPIPALVPLPTLAMAPMPSAVSIVNGQVKLANAGVNPGYPFFVPATAGHRPPNPPLDTVDDGGLPRHVIVGGLSTSIQTRLDFSKTLVSADARAVSETGDPVELTAMAFHAQRTHPAFTQKGVATSFVTNGQPARAGAPYADPCVDDQGKAVGAPVLYKAAGFQMDLKINKVGWHTPQARMLALWADVNDTIAGRRAPQPLFFRVNSGSCITFHHTNLIPANYELDDFQVRTPTDIIGQHIHLVKFDVTSSDGSGNGWNYEDGTLAPEETIERIRAINAAGGLRLPNGTRQTLTPKAHPFFGTLGAKTTVQRWYADPIVNNGGTDRTLRTVFTHDHFGPSTHQQVGLYAGLVVEPAGSRWRDPETGAAFGGRFDGGPTSWHADILTANAANSYREFMVEFADFHLAYEAGGGIDAQGRPRPDPAKAIIPAGVEAVGLPFLFARPEVCPGGVPVPCPEAISASDNGTIVVNYRNEPIALRVQDPSSGTPQQAAGQAGDLAFAYSTKVVRKIPDLNQQPNFYPPLTAGLADRDPFTPMFRAYQGDNVQIRMLVGAHEEGHVHTVNGIKWLQEPSERKSGWRGAQMTGISEHFEFLAPLTEVDGTKGPFWDHLYRPTASMDGQWNGAWGLMRAYKNKRPNLLPLPNNDNFKLASLIQNALQITLDPDAALLSGLIQELKVGNPSDFTGVCPRTAPVRNFDVTAISAAALPGGKLIYNPRVGSFGGNPGPLNDPTALIYANSSDLDVAGALKPGVPVEPLVLRAIAGDCIMLTLRNRLPATVPDQDGFSGLPPVVMNFNANQIRPSSNVGMQPQLLAYDVSRDDGMNIGRNTGDGTVPPGGSITYRWYAGDLTRDPVTDKLIATPVEFGTANLLPADTIEQGLKGLGAVLVVEPPGATWTTDAKTRTAATVTSPSGTFREFVVMTQGSVNLRDRNGKAICPTAGAGAEAGVTGCQGSDDAEESGNQAVNYRSEPMWFRLGYDPGAPLEDTRNVDTTNAVSNTQVGGDPATPVFTAKAGTPVRFRIGESAGHFRNGVFQVHGHVWQREPYVAGSVASQSIGNNPQSEYRGVQEGLGTGNHFDIVLQNGAGGAFKVPGDYLFRDQASFELDNGRWGLFRVQP